MWTLSASRAGAALEVKNRSPQLRIRKDEAADVYGYVRGTTRIVKAGKLAPRMDTTFWDRGRAGLGTLPLGTQIILVHEIL